MRKLFSNLPSFLTKALNRRLLHSFARLAAARGAHSTVHNDGACKARGMNRISYWEVVGNKGIYSIGTT